MNESKILLEKALSVCSDGGCSDLAREIEEYLKKPEQEPVAWSYPEGLELLNKRGTFTSVTLFLFANNDDCLIPLYTKPPRQEPVYLSESEIYRLGDGENEQNFQFARSIEKAVLKANGLIK